MSGKTDMGGPAFVAIHEAAQAGNDEELWDSLDALDTEDLRALLLCKLRAKSDAEAWHDYAAAALQGIISCGPHDCDVDGLAHDAAIQADAMLAERAKRTEGTK